MDYRKKFRVDPGDKLRLNKLDPAYKDEHASEAEAKPPIVPGGELAKPVVGDHEGAALGLVQMVERDGRNLLEPQAPGGEHPAMAREDAAFLVDEDRDVEPEGRDAVGDAGDLAGDMNARVSRIGRQSLDRQPADRDPRGRSFGFRIGIVIFRRAMVLHPLDRSHGDGLVKGFIQRGMGFLSVAGGRSKSLAKRAPEKAP